MNNYSTFRRATLVTAMLGICGFAMAQSAVKLTLGHGAAPGNPRHEASVKFAEIVKTKSNGRIEVQVAPSAQLGDDAAMVTSLRTGALDMSANSQGAVANAVPEYAAYGMPFMFYSPAQAFKVLDGPLGKELADKSAEKGMILLGTWDNGIRQMTNSKRPIGKVEDMKGLKMRVPPDATLVDIMQALGAEAQQIKFAELYVALQQGVVGWSGEPAGEHPRQQALRSAKASGTDQPPISDDALPDEQAHLGSSVRGRPQNCTGSRPGSHDPATQDVTGCR